MLKINNLIIVAISIFSILFYFLGVGWIQVSHFPITFTFIFLILVVFFYELHIKGLNISEVLLMLPFLFLNLLYLIRMNGEVLMVFYQFFFMFLVMCLYKVKFTKNNLRMLSIVFSGLLILNLYLSMNLDEILLIVTNVPFYSGKASGNSISMFSMYLSFFPILYNVYYKSRTSKISLIIIICLLITTIIASSARSILIALTIILLTYLLWHGISRNKRIYGLYFGLFVVSISIFIIIYPNLDSILPNFNEINSFVLEVTGKRIMSGRNLLWKYTWGLIQKAPIMGYGSGSSLTDYFLLDLESHNLYLQVGFQVGIFGMAFLVMFFNNIWKQFFIAKSDNRVALSASYFIGIIIYQVFEIGLIQNGFDRSFFPWVIIGVGLSFAMNRNQSFSKEKKYESIS